ncbi:Clavaminate synthase [Dipodascopsis uninucleata]
MGSDLDEIRNALEELIEVSQDVTTTFVPSKRGPPKSPLEFLKQINSNFPIVYKGAAIHWAALDPLSGRQWSREYFERTMGDEIIEVAQTPLGNADAPVGNLFVEPYTKEMTMREFICALVDSKSEIVHYMQSQNSNMDTVFAKLTEDIEVDLDWATEAIGDHYENLHVQVLGKKIFRLISPIEHISVKERQLQRARYIQKNGSRIPVFDTEVIGDDFVPWPTLDPAKISDDPWATEWNCRVLTVTLEPGDMLYLPALWYHSVSQVANDEGLCCSVNMWYDMDFSNHLWPMWSFVRRISNYVTSHSPTSSQPVDENNCTLTDNST